MLIYGAGLDDAEAVRTYWHEHLEGQVLSLGEVFPDVTPSVAYTHTAEQLWEKVRHEAKLRGYFAIQGLDLFSIIEADVRLLTLDLMPQLVALAERAPRALVDVHGGVILMGGTQGKHRVIAKAAHAAGVPVVTMHYGGPYGYTDCPMTEYYDLADVDYFLCYGEGTARYLEQPSPAAYVRPGSRRAKLVAVGSPALDKVVARQRQCAGKTVDNDKLAYGEQELLAATTERAREVMYVIGAMIGDLRYFSYNLCPDIWYWRLHREVVKTCICFPNVRLIVKPPLKGRIPEVPNPLSEWILKNGVRNCELLHDVPFEEVLHLADAYITDCPSTVLLQAMTTMKPVIVYLDRTLYRLDRHAMTLLRKRATVSETREEFLQDIADFLHRPDWTLPRPVNDEFLCAYGTYLNDGRSAERAAQLLMDLAKQ